MIHGLVRDRQFLAGAAVRLLLLLFVAPLRHVQQTVPFLLTPGAMPWSTWSAEGKPLTAFSSGIPEWLALAPATWAGGQAGSAVIGLMLIIFLVDCLGYSLLKSASLDERRDEVAGLYWLSPIPILLTYWTGAVAVLPIALLFGGFVAIRHRRYAVAGALFGLAIATRPSLGLLLPSILVFAIALGKVRTGGTRLVGWAIGTSAVLLLLPAFFGGFREMVLFSAEVRQMLGVRLFDEAGAGAAIIPLAIVGLAYATWRIRLLSAAMLWALFVIALLVMAGLGRLPIEVTLVLFAFLTTHVAYAEASGRALFAVFSVLVAVWMLLFEPGAVVLGLGTLDPQTIWSAPGIGASVVLVTGVAAIALALAVQTLVRGVLRAGDHLASKKTIAIGIAGDSGAGKDTLAAGLAALFSKRTVVSVSGDDYHNWDRNKPMWRALTHLNPRANDLATFAQHTSDLIDRRWVRARHYDHASGRMTKPLLIRPGEIVVASGLHALLSPQLNAQYDLRVYLDMDEELRRFLKVQRDVHVRGHPLERVLASIRQRYQDAVEFIHPQKDAAQMVLRLEPRSPERLAGAERIDQVGLRLRVQSAPGIGMETLVRVLVAFGNLHAVLSVRTSGATELVVEGDPSAQDVAVMGRRVAPQTFELLRAEPDWEKGLKGVMQVIMLDQLEQIRRRRSVQA